MSSSFVRFASPLGPVLVVVGPAGVRRVALTSAEAARAMAEVDPAPAAPSTAARIRRAFSAYFAGGRPTPDVDVDLQDVRGFTREVLATLRRRVGFGRTISYGELAHLVGRPKSARAVGQAVGSNPVPILVPCHRVLASDGSLGGFGSGLARKRLLLKIEGITGLSGGWSSARSDA